MTPIWIAGAVGVVVALGIGFWLWRSGTLLWWDIQDDGNGKDTSSSDDASDRKENWHE